ncbi:MAG: HD domain-containing protein [Calditrichia bacterium]|nr:HD domain-containing protein [Calditrichia bacterium]
MNSVLEKALEIALQAHRGQQDRYGEPYILHPLRVMARVHTEEQKIVALLHDVIEDSAWTIEQLEQEGFVVEIFEAVQALTKQPGEDYMNYIRRTAVTNLSLTVKMADLKDNMDLTRCKQLKPADLKRMEKYLKARQYLQKVLTETNQ